MGTGTNDALDNARAQAQELHKQIDATLSKGVEAMRGDFPAISAKARQLRQTLINLATTYQPEMRTHLSGAASELQNAAEHSKGESDAEFKQSAQAALSRVREALQELSRAVAARRSAEKSAKV